MVGPGIAAAVGLMRGSEEASQDQRDWYSRAAVTAAIPRGHTRDTDNTCNTAGV